MNKLHYHLGDHLLSKNDIAMNLATEGFRFVAFEQSWDMCQASQLNDRMGIIENNLSDEDCEEFVNGLQNSLHDGEQLYQHVTEFTCKMLKKWHLIEVEE